MSAMKTYVILALCMLCWLSTASACMQIQNQNDLANCLQDIAGVFTDSDRFWFGSTYASKCLETQANAIDCTALRNLTGNQSMYDILFGTGTFIPSALDRLLNVTFTSAKGEYEVCGHEFETEEDVTFSLNPVNPRVHKPFDVRATPEITWRADPGKQYTLLVLDVGFGYTHGVYVNINGGNLQQSEALIPYFGSGTFNRFPAPYVFLLYEQVVPNITVNYEPITNPFALFDVPVFVSEYNLIGPKALNWMVIETGPYALYLGVQMNTLQRCSILIDEVLKDENLPFLPANFQEYGLPGYAEVSITTPEDVKLTYCCQDIEIEQDTIMLDPIDDEVYSPAQARTGSTIDIVLSRTGIRPNKSADFKDQLFTVINVDPDVPYDTAGTKSRPLLHWMVQNMAVDSEGLLVGGSEVQSYRGPRPPALEPTQHSYYFLIYQQSGTQEQAAINSSFYSGDSCVERLVGRCLFDVAEFASDNDLTLFTVSWMTAENDLWTQNERGVSQAEACTGLEGYKDPCPTPKGGGADHLTSSVTTLLILQSIAAVLLLFCKF